MPANTVNEYDWANAGAADVASAARIKAAGIFIRLHSARRMRRHFVTEAVEFQCEKDPQYPHPEPNCCDSHGRKRSDERKGDGFRTPASEISFAPREHSSAVRRVMRRDAQGTSYTSTSATPVVLPTPLSCAV
jgi:hypothetical protein